MPESPQSKSIEKWTTAQLMKYFEMRFDNLEKSLDERYITQEKAIAVANEASNKRLDSMNEFRETLRDQNKTFITQAEHNSLIALVNEKFDTIEDSIKAIQISDAVLAGKASQSQFIVVLIISIVGLIASIMRLFIG